MYEILKSLITTLVCGSVWHHAESLMQPNLEQFTFSRGSQLSASAYMNEPLRSLFECTLRYGPCHNKRSLRTSVRKCYSVYIIAHEIIVSNSVSEYTHGSWKVSGACPSLMSSISEQASATNVSGFLIEMNENSLF